jgi:hypothetical protein
MTAEIRLRLNKVIDELTKTGRLDQVETLKIAHAQMVPILEQNQAELDKRYASALRRKVSPVYPRIEHLGVNLNKECQHLYRLYEHTNRTLFNAIKSYRSEIYSHYTLMLDALNSYSREHIEYSPLCPFCKSHMTPFNHREGEEPWSSWGCNCKEIAIGEDIW